ncbi:MAG: hypothetical protein ACLPYZ_15365 [Limisphaerales bacterium]
MREVAELYYEWIGRAGNPSAFAARQSATTARRRLPAVREQAKHGAHGLSRHSRATAEVTRPACDYLFFHPCPSVSIRGQKI